LNQLPKRPMAWAAISPGAIESKTVPNGIPVRRAAM
jgi:hypothetical protein